MKTGYVGLIVIAILMVVVAASGCTGGSKTLFTYNLSAGEAPNYIAAQNFTVPNGTSKITIQATNLTRLNSNLNTSYVDIYALSTVPVTVAVNGNNTNFLAQYNSSIVLQKRINLANETNPLSLNNSFNNTQIKGFLIVNVNAKGLIQILAD